MPFLESLTATAEPNPPPLCLTRTTDLAAFATVAADTDRKRVIVAGLDGDFKRQRFGQMLDLVPLADRVVKLAGR